MPSATICSSRSYDAQSAWTSGAPGSIAATKSVSAGKRLVVDLDQARGLGGGGLGERGHTRHDLALEPHDVLREQRAVLHETPEADVGQVVLRDHRDDAGQRARPRRVDAEDPRVGVVGVAERGVSHAGGR